VRIDSVQYFWHEYLMYNPMIGFRWLVHSDNHWDFVEPVNAGDVGQGGLFSNATTVDYQMEVYKIFQDAQAIVEYVQGEFYWRVEQGERVHAVDYVSPPRMLSLEMTADENNWSLGTYMTNDEIEKIFGVTGLPRPWGVAPNQPFTGQFYYTWGALPLLGLIVVAILMIPLSGSTKTVLSQQLTLPAMTTSTTEQTVSSQEFDLRPNSNVRFTAGAPVDNSWADLDVDLVNDQTGVIAEEINVPVEYYSGVDDGESWSEGDKSPDATISSVPGGKYSLQVHGTWQNWQAQMPVSVKVEQGVNRGVNFTCALLVLLIVPTFGLLRKWTFESARWKDSMFTSSGKSNLGDSDDSDE